MALVTNPLSMVSTSTSSVWSIRSWFSTGSILSAASVGSIQSFASAGSILSLGSAGSILSVGSAGSILSVGSAGSVLSIRSQAATLSVDNRPVGPTSPRARAGITALAVAGAVAIGVQVAGRVAMPLVRSAAA